VLVASKEVTVVVGQSSCTDRRAAAQPVAGAVQIEETALNNDNGVREKKKMKTCFNVGNACGVSGLKLYI
jgi:hypothetical protein